MNFDNEVHTSKTQIDDVSGSAVTWQRLSSCASDVTVFSSSYTQHHEDLRCRTGGSVSIDRRGWQSVPASIICQSYRRHGYRGSLSDVRVANCWPRPLNVCNKLSKHSNDVTTTRFVLVLLCFN